MSFRPIFGKPRLIHDWGDELHERETHWTSLFYDLVIVAALNAIAEPFEEVEEHPTQDGEQSLIVLPPIKHLWLNALLQFVSVVTPWNSLNDFTSLFEDESFGGHLCFFVHCLGLASITAGCVGELEYNYKTLAIGIIITKLSLLILYVRPYIYIPRVRARATYRCASFFIVILLMLWGMNLDFEHFRTVLIVSSVWEWASVMLVLFLKEEQRVRMHVQAYTERQKEVTMVIFGEAIFAVTLRSKSTTTEASHFYLALTSTLWLIYSLALQEYHIVPKAEDHALTRSIFFGFSWHYTQIFKQIFLLGASLGLKRAHLLTFVAPQQPIDQDTRYLLVWGISLTLVSVVVIRSYSFGYGRHPSKFDPAPLWRVKVAWWTALSLLCLSPQLVDFAILRECSQPLVCLVALGAMMFLIILVEAYVSNKAARLAKMYRAIPAEEAGEMTYLVTPSSREASLNNPNFLQCYGPKNDTVEAAGEDQ